MSGLKRSCAIGLDLGTTSAKAIAFDEANKVVAKTSQEVETCHGRHGEAEQDPDLVADAAVKVLTETAKEASAKGYQVTLVGFSAAMHSLIAVDGGGKPLTKALIWMDGRAADEAMRLRRSDACGALYQRTGAPIHPMTPLLKLIWFRKHRPELLQQAARFVSQKEYIWARWFHEWVIDESMAGATGLYALETRKWDADALELAGIRESQLSEIVPTSYCKRADEAGAGDKRKSANVTLDSALADGPLAGAVFNIGSSDGVLANLGVGATDHQSMVLTIGTSCAIRLTTERAYLDQQHMPFCYRLDDEHYVVGGPSNSGGIVVDWLASEILAGGEDNFDGLLFEAEHTDAGDLLCLPYIAGERAPLWNAHSSGSLIGLQVNHGPAHVFRAGLEGILLNANWIVQSLMREDYQPKQVVASGKLLESAFMRQLCADIFDIPIAACEDADASVLGAVALARIAVGETTYAAIGRKLDNPQSTLPDAAQHEVYAEKYKRFRALVAAVMGAGAARAGGAGSGSSGDHAGNSGS